MKEIIINRNDCDQRLDKFLTKTFRTMPISLVYKYLRTKRIKVNGKKSEGSFVLSEGDVINLYIPEEFFGEKRENAFEHLKKDVKVCYEDENIMVVHKPKGLLCHSEDASDTDTLIDRIKAKLYREGNYSPENENSFAPALCNRIDRNTEGLVIAAKNAQSLREMNDIIRDREIHKEYLAAVHGFFKNKKGKMTSYLEKNAEENKVYVHDRATKSTVTAVLCYEVLAENKKDGLSLLSIELLTGRTHQIRAQMASSGHPLLGDGKYAVNKADRKNGYSSQSLCSYSLQFDFSSEHEKLGYLNGKKITTEKPDFLKLF